MHFTWLQTHSEVNVCNRQIQSKELSPENVERCNMLLPVGQKYNMADIALVCNVGLEMKSQ